MEFSSETLEYFRKCFNPNYKYFRSQMNKLEILIDSEDELEHFKVHYWMKAQRMKTQFAFYPIEAIYDYRIHKVKKLDMSFEEFLFLYNQDRLHGLTKLFLQPINKSYLKWLDQEIGSDSIEILFKLHKLQPSQLLFRLLSQKVTLKERYERDLEHYRKEGSSKCFETPTFFESNVYHPKGDFHVEDIGFEEWEKKLKLHYDAERKPQVIKLAKERFKEKHGKLFCESCGFNFYEVYGEIGQDFIEGHHKIPVTLLVEGQKSRVGDIALVCSNCHKMLHKRRPCLTIVQLRDLIQVAKEDMKIAR